MRFAVSRFIVALSMVAAGSYACSAASGSGFDPDGGGGGTDSGGGGDGSAGDSGSFGDVNLGDSPLADNTTPGKTILYAHTNTALFKVNADDPQLAITKVGDFDCTASGSMTDLAVDKDGKLYGVSSKNVYLDMTLGATVGCANKGVALPSGAAFYGASFAPAGTVDPNVETLIVANSDGQLFQVNTTNGQTTQVGTFGLVPANDGNGHTYPAAHVGKAWELSGDIVFLANNGQPVGFATVRDCPTPPSTTGCNKTDTLVQIDMSLLKSGNTASVTKAVRGQVVKSSGCTDPNHTGYGSMYGIAAYKGDIIGFSREPGEGGTLSLTVRVNNNDGTACLVADDTSQATGGWAGAGVTTQAPVTVPPPR